MSESEIVHSTIQVLTLILMLSMPPIVVAALSGILVSLFQALTQIQEQTLSFAIKLIAVSVTLVVTARWIGIELFNYASNIFDAISTLG